MGLMKAMDTQFGVMVDYWHVGALYYDKREQMVRVTVYGYATQKARLAGATSLLTRQYDLPTSGTGETVVDVTQTVDGILKSVYGILTTAMMPVALQAVDVLGKEKAVDVPFCEFYGAKEA